MVTISHLMAPGRIEASAQSRRHCNENKKSSFDKLVDTNCGPTIVESQRNVSGFLPTAGEETAFFSEHPVPPCSHQTNCGEIVQLVINHLKYILFELFLLVFKNISWNPFARLSQRYVSTLPLGDTM